MLNISKSERILILTFLVMGLFFTALSYYKKISSADVPAVIDIREKRTLININTASPIQLEKLPGIGPVLAERIVAYREAKGGFRSTEELNNVKGIGPENFENIKDLITLNE